MKYFLVLTFITIAPGLVWASNLVQVPEQCLEKENAPCLVRAPQDQFIVTPSNLKFYFGKEALIKVTEFPGKSEPFKVEILTGKVVITHDKKIPFYVNAVSVGLNDTYYIKKGDKNKLDLYKTAEAGFLSITRQEGMDLVETKDFASRKSVTDFINEFTNIPGSVYKLTLQQYENRLNDEVANQQRILQRKIAAEENTRRLDAEARQKQKIENKRIKELFFMRTFEQ